VIVNDEFAIVLTYMVPFLISAAAFAVSAVRAIDAPVEQFGA
jgi:hypothetical protein